MSSPAAAVTHLVPVGSLGAGVVAVARQAAVVAVLPGAVGGQVALGATEEAGHHLLHTHNTHPSVPLVLRQAEYEGVCDH